MSAVHVLDRPIWRRFRPKYLARAAAHVRAGGHAVITHPDDRIEVLLGVDAEGRIAELGLWALLAIEMAQWRRVHDGPAKGLATAQVTRRFEGSVLDWCERDSVHPGSVRRIELDCLACAACCHDPFVLLDDADLDRWRRAGRADLAGPAYVRQESGVISLRLAPSGRCQHLEERACGIYPIRPDNCRSFVAGSEACLSAREDTLGIRDGAPQDR
ncbi:MAG: YkgJ family cysteine cluster protein [Polyangiaceae bacterium]|nr:YkgJ family cysteine cluster protein [Polyangiaceae bacterium]